MNEAQNEAMKNAYLMDFHHGWLIEIVPIEQGFKATCYSPCRTQLLIQAQCASNFDVLYVAKHAIDYQVACSTLSGLLREFYEAGQLSFEEWNSLHRSLNQVTKNSQ